MVARAAFLPGGEEATSSGSLPNWMNSTSSGECRSVLEAHERDRGLRAARARSRRFSAG